MSSDSDQSKSQGHSALDDIRAARLEKVEQIKALGLNPYAYRWESTHQTQALQEKYKDFYRNHSMLQSNLQVLKEYL